MGRICVVTQDPRMPGGVATKLGAFLRWAETRGHVCDIYFPVTEADDGGGNWVGEFESVDRVEAVRVVTVPHFVRAATFGWRCEFADGYDAYQLIAGSLYLGLPLLKRSKPFGAWIAGTSEADVQATGRTKLRHYLLYNPVMNECAKRQEIRVGSRASFVLVDSRCSARLVAADLGVDDEKIGVLPAPVDVERFIPGSPVRTPRRYVLSVARLDRRKDFPTLIRAFRLVVDELGDIELRIVGDGKEAAVLRRVVGDLQLDDHVKFLGHVTSTELVRQYQGASLFALASRQEGIGIVFLEALACGVPIVATDSGGSADPVVPGKTGFLVPVGDAESLAECMESVLRDPGLADRLGRAGRAKAESEYSVAVIDTRLDEAYQRTFDLDPRGRSTG